MGSCLMALCTGLQAQEPAAHLSVTERVLAVTSLVDPFGVAVDQSGNLYVADEFSGTVAEVQLNGDLYLESVTVLQGLSWPSGLAVDAQGNLYITEDGNTNDVIKETASSTPDGTVYTRSVITASGLGVPSGIAVDPMGNVYVADSSNNRILKETPSGDSYTQTVVPSSALSSPYGVAVDASGDVLIADWGHSRVLKETISGNSYTESVVTANTVNNPFGVAIDGSGNIYVLNFVDQETSSLLKETPSEGSYVQSALAFAPDLNAEAIAANGSGNIYLASPGTYGLHKLVTGAGDFGQVSVLGPSLPVSVIFTFDQAGTIGTPAVLTQGASGLDFVDAGNIGGRCGGQGPGFVYNVGDSCVVGVLFNPTTSGSRYGVVALPDTAGNPVALGYVYGVGLGGQLGFPPGVEANIDSPLAHPMGVAVDAGGGIYVAESATGTVYKETLSSGPAARTILAQGLSNPTGVAVDGAGNIYIAASSAVYKETPVQGGYSQSKVVAGLDHLAGIAVDANANLYLISSTSGDVHKETLAAGGTYTETSIGAGIANPTGVAADSSGNIFVADARQGALYEETLRADGTYAQSVIATGLNAPAGIAVDGGTPLGLEARAHLFVTASGDGVVYEFFEQADGTYLQGMEYAVSSTPWGIAVDGLKNLYITQNVGDAAIIKIDLADPPALSFATTRVGSVSADQPVTVTNVGNSSVYIAPLSSGAHPSLSTGFSLSSETTCPKAGYDPEKNPGLFLLANDSCIYTIDFAPQTHASYKGALVITGDNLGTNLARRSISLGGLGIISDTTRTTMRVSPNPVKVGLGVTITVTVTDTYNAASVPTGGVVATDTVGNVTTSLNGGAPVTLSGGKAVLTMTPSVAGMHTVTAHYNGVNGSFAGSTMETDLSVQPYPSLRLLSNPPGWLPATYH